jgi:hypothetical protein
MTFLAPEADRIVRTAVDAYFDGRLRPEIDGEAVFETRNSRYRLVDGTLLAASDATLVGCELVGWLTESTAEVQVSPWWTPGARAVLVDRQQGRHIVVTSATRLLKVDTLGPIRGSRSPLGGSGARQGSPAPAPIVAAVAAHPAPAQPPATGALPPFPSPVPATPHAPPYSPLSAAPMAARMPQPGHHAPAAHPAPVTPQAPHAPVTHHSQAPYAAPFAHPAPPLPPQAAYCPTEPGGGGYVSPAAHLPLPPRRREPLRPSSPAEAPPFAVALSVPAAPPPPRIEPAPEYAVRRAEPVHPPPRRVVPEAHGPPSRPLASPFAPPRPGARAASPASSRPPPSWGPPRSERVPPAESAPATQAEPLPRFFNDDSVAAPPPMDTEASAPEISIVEVLGSIGAGGPLPRFADPGVVTPGDDADTERQMAPRSRPAPPPPGPLASPRGKHTPPPPPSQRFPISGR